ncbi:protease TldD [Achromatium sp. WMS2]|nr:protease TldD [Achromatium sp. WMS2]
MTNTDLARSILLDASGITPNDIDKVLARLGTKGIDAADIYFQSSRLEHWALEESIVKESSYIIETGVGISAISGEKIGLAYSNDLALAPMLEAAAAARSIANSTSSSVNKVKIPPKFSSKTLYQPLDPLVSMPDANKVELLNKIDAVARSRDPRIEKVSISLTAAYSVIMVIDQDGTAFGDIRPMVRLNVHVIAKSGKRIEQGSSGGGLRRGLDWCAEESNYRRIANEAVDQALVNLEAVATPAGTMTVVLAPGWPGILLHEAIGHGLEGDFNRKGTSAFAGRIGQRIAAPGCTVVDDGTVTESRGSLNIDDEGTPSQYTILIENGILKGYMQDKFNAHLMGTISTGNGRRESYAHLPLPRMTNTYMLPGSHTHAEIIASVSKGLYAANFGGGQVDITSGKFVFSASEAYLIENGRIICPVKGATLIGNGPEVLTKVAMIGNNLEFDPGVGTCGKEGQSVPVSVGQPTLRVDGLTVGGTVTD